MNLTPLFLAITDKEDYYKKEYVFLEEVGENGLYNIVEFIFEKSIIELNEICTDINKHIICIKNGNELEAIDAQKGGVW